MLIDTHCHLDAAEFDTDRSDQVSRARHEGVAVIVVPAVGAVNFDTVRQLSRQFDCCRYALGIHPMYVERAGDDELIRLREQVARSIDDPALVGIGEIGLDYFVPGLDRQRQGYFFEEQLRIARDFDLPVILHVRRSQDQILKELRRFRPRSGIAHAFNGSHQQAMMFVNLGFALGFGGAFTFTRALQIRRLVRELPSEAHVLETDAPDISPAWLAPAPNSPHQVAGIAREFAQLREQSFEQVLSTTGENALRVLPRLASGMPST